MRKSEVSIERNSVCNVKKNGGAWIHFCHAPIAVGRGVGGGAIVLGKLPGPGRPTIWMTVGQGPTAFAVGADGGCLDFFFYSSRSFLSSVSVSLGDGPI